MRRLFFILTAVLLFTAVAQDKNITMERVESLYAIEPYTVGRTVSINGLGDIFAVSSNRREVYVMKNGSFQWTRIFYSAYEWYVLEGIYSAPDNSLFISTSSHGLFYSSDTENYSLSQILVETEVFSVIQNSSGTIFCGSSDGLYKSDNNGISWSHTYEYPLKMAVSSTDVMYIDEYNKGLCRSTDLGVNWEEINFNLSTDIEVTDIQVATDGTVFISVKNNGMYKLSGTEWIAQGFNYTNVNSIHAGKDGNMYCSLNDKIYKKTVAMSHWNEIKSSQGRISTFSSNSNKLIAGYTDNLLIFESTDWGSTWTTNGQKIYPTVLSVLTRDRYVIVGTVNGVYRSDDYGSTWSEKQLDFDIYSIALGKYDRIYLGTSYGIFRSSDYGLTWVQRTNTYYVYKVLYKDDIIYEIGFRGIRKSINFESTWIDIPENFNYPKDAVKLNNGRIYIADYWPGIWFTDDEINWTDTGLGNRANAVESNSGGDVFASVDGILKKLAYGETDWTTCLSEPCESLYIDNDDIIFVGGKDDIQYSLFGTVWTTIYGTPSSTTVNAIERDKNGYIYAGMASAKGLYKSNIPLVVK